MNKQVAWLLAFWLLIVETVCAQQVEKRDMELLGHNDLQGRSAYQPTIQRQGNRWIAYIGHHRGETLNPLTGRMEHNGTSVVDVTDPRAPKFLAHIPGEASGAQMTRVCDGKMLPKGDPKKVYLLRTFGDSADEVWDVTVPEKPSRVSKINGFRSTHKNYWECDTGIAYLPASGERNTWRASRVTHIYDLSDPAKPVKIREFALAEQRAESTAYEPHQIHGPISMPQLNRVFFGYGTSARGVGQIVDREKLLKGAPRPTVENLKAPEIGRIILPQFLGAHTTFPLYGMEIAEFAADREGRLRNFVVVVNEASGNKCSSARQMVWFIDVTDEERPLGVSNFNVPEASGDFCKRGGRFGAHASNENMTAIYYKRLMFFSYFNAGVRAVDVRDPYQPQEVAYYIPAITDKTEKRCPNPESCKAVIQINNVEVDDRGYIYAVDRANSGLFILELSGAARKIANFSAER